MNIQTDIRKYEYEYEYSSHTALEAFPFAQRLSLPMASVLAKSLKKGSQS